LAECVSETASLINPAKLWNKDVEEASEEFFDLYDLDGNGVVGWKEYHSINSYNKKPLKSEKEVFTFLDRNIDWKITPKEFAKAKLKKLKPKKE
jgi:Ca2+-binding EF-hand superfamily protein